MTVKTLIATLTQQEDLNFLLTNRIPRAALTRFMGWFSKIENPLVRDLSIACWRLFSDLDLVPYDAVGGVLPKAADEELERLVTVAMQVLEEEAKG